MDGNSVSVSVRLQNATSELRDIEALLASADLDPRILSDFRDAVNRIRTTAWATQQYSESRDTDRDPSSVLTLLAGERIRAAYQLCRAIRQDLDRAELSFQPGQLIQLRTVVHDLDQRLNALIGDSK